MSYSRTKVFKTLLFSFLFLNSSCGEENSTLEALLSESDSSSQNVVGRAKNSFDGQAKVEQKFTYEEVGGSEAASSLSGAYVAFPAGSLVSEDSKLDIYIEPGDLSLHQKIRQDLSLDQSVSIESVASPLIVYPSKEVTVQSAFTVAIPIPKGSSLLLSELKNLTVFYQIYDFQKKEIRSGLKVKNLKTSADAQFVLMDTKFFGSFQAVYLKEAISNDLEIKSTATEIKSSLDQSVIFSTSSKESLASNLVSLSASSQTLAENEGTVLITAKLSKLQEEDVLISFSFTGEALANSDYTKKDSITIAQGSTEASFTLTAIDDDIYEGDESLVVEIISASKASISDSQKKVSLSLTDDEALPELSLSCDLASILENSSDKITCSLALSHQTTQTVSVATSYSKGTATKNSDFTPASVSHSLAAGSSSLSWEITVNDDSNYEGNETIIVEVDSVTNAMEAGGSQEKTITLIEDDSDPNTRIAFTSYRTSTKKQLYLMHADGSNQTKISDFGGNTIINDMSPSLSKDRTKIVYFITQWHVWIMNADGSNPTRLTTSGTNKWPAISPDGTKIAYSKWASYWDIYVMNIDGSNATRLTTHSDYDTNAAWSPDGTKILFSSRRDGNYEIYVMDVDGSNKTRLTNNSAYDKSPSWSPDGSKIAFSSDRDGNHEIYVMDPDGSNQTRLTTATGDDDFPSWSPDSLQLAFSSKRDSDQEIYKMNADGTNQTRLTNNPGFDGYPSWK